MVSTVNTPAGPIRMWSTLPCPRLASWITRQPRSTSSSSRPPTCSSPRGAAVAALDQRQHVAGDHEHAHQQRHLRAEEAQVVQAERAPEQGGRDREHPERDERAQAQPLHGRARVLSGRAAGRDRGSTDVHLSFSGRLSYVIGALRTCSLSARLDRARAGRSPRIGPEKRGEARPSPKAWMSRPPKPRAERIAPDRTRTEARMPPMTRPIPIISHPSDICLLLRAHGEQRWLTPEVVPVLRQLEQRERAPRGAARRRARLPRGALDRRLAGARRDRRGVRAARRAAPAMRRARCTPRPAATTRRCAPARRSLGRHVIARLSRCACGPSEAECAPSCPPVG